MCGIIGYTGSEQAAPILLEGLKSLEYRGYDSAGIAVENPENKKIEIVRRRGRIAMLCEATDDGKTMPGKCGIGHTRWATHGEPSEANAHPHRSSDMKVTIVHNGIIENYAQLKEKLLKNGYTFSSQTDTEVAANLIAYYYNKTNNDPLEALTRAMLRMKGSFALGVIFEDIPGVVYTCRLDSPLIVGKGTDGYYIASDVTAILSHTRTVYYMNNMEIAKLSEESVTFYNIDREEISKESTEIKWDREAAERGGFEHYMIKEIHEQPRAVRDTLSHYVHDGKVTLGENGPEDALLSSLKRIYIVACGSAYHVGVAARVALERIANIPVEAELASEFRYKTPLFEKDSLVIIISQSGETADSLAALRIAKQYSLPTLGIVNTVGSTIAREADYVMYTMAGPEISVATTKAYSTQLIVSYLLAMKIGELRGKVSEEENAHYIEELEALPKKIEKILEDKERMQWFASKFSGAQDAYFLGRGIDYCVALEGSLKLKEISYIHSEAYAAGELKHGTISLIEPGTLVVGMMTGKELFDKTLSNVIEVKSRGAYVLAVTSYGEYAVEDVADITVYVPNTDPCFSPSLSVVPLQLLSYYVSVARGLDVDKPRNLAKSVTVE